MVLQLYICISIQNTLQPSLRKLVLLQLENHKGYEVNETEIHGSRLCNAGGKRNFIYW
jgi:hypothetical protein